MSEEKTGKIEVPKPPGFLRRNRLLFIAAGGIFALHLTWWQLVETYVPAAERPKRFEFLGKLDSLIQKDEAEKN